MSLSLTAGQVLLTSATEATALADGTPIVTFTDANPGDAASAFVATIDWGDGSPTTPGTVVGSNGSFTVEGGHTYQQEGTDTAQVTISQVGGSTLTMNPTVVVNEEASIVTELSGSGVEGAPLSLKATFPISPADQSEGPFTATINWGDNTPTTTGAVVLGGDGIVTVTGTHTYADENNYAAQVTLKESSGDVESVATGQVTVADSDTLLLTADNISGQPGIAFNNVQVATFTDTYAANVAGDFVAQIDWGDGQTTSGTVSGSNGSFTVNGSHTYTTGGQYTTVVSADDDRSNNFFFTTGTSGGRATASINLPGQMIFGSATENVEVDSVVATFTDSDSSDLTFNPPFTASIDWGDNVTTTGSVTTNGSTLSVIGSHTYTDEGSDPAIVILTRTTDGASSTVSGTVSVGEDDLLLAELGATITANANQAFSGTVVSFNDPDNAFVAGDFTASIDWGDGQTTTGTVSRENGPFGHPVFIVNGSHTYTAGGQDTVKVTLVDDAPGKATATATITATVRSLSGQMALSAATEHLALANSTSVATFSDTNTSDQATDFTASIDWGDSSPATTGSVTGSNGTFTVSGGHSYADEGNEQASVTLTHTADQFASTASGSIKVADDDVLTGHGTAIAAIAGHAVNGAVATFTDVNTTSPASDFAATVDWGDGQTTTGTVSGGNGSLTVGGSHTYVAHGQDTVRVTLADDAPSTASATATSTVTVANTVPFDLNGDTTSDLVFQNNGQPGIWLWNGTDPTAEVGLTNPGASWHIVTSRDVNGDGKADLIWQNNDGTPGIWLMNGTAPISEAGLPNPGPSWNLVAAGDVNGDGKADLIWQDLSGNLGVWEMNGTTPIAEAGIGNPGTHWNVVGTADFNNDGKDDILLQNTTTGNLMVDLMNGTSVMSSVSITIGVPSWHAVSTGEFNGQADITWQNNDGSVGLWLMNGTTPVAEAGLGNPGAGWQLVSVDHFTPNGQPDLLFQNTNGAMMLWEMNGTSVTAMVNLPNAGAWQSVNGHPFATG
jgi:hypothetical protein